MEPGEGARWDRGGGGIGELFRKETQSPRALGGGQEGKGPKDR